VAIVKWRKSTYLLFNDYVENARLEYGEKTAKKWISNAAEIFAHLQKYPESYTPEPLLKNRIRKYRSCRLMGNRFRIVYYYNPSTDIVRIVDIWDTRMNPEALAKRVNP
jgi:plasmid stabilization system protein ParE